MSPAEDGVGAVPRRRYRETLRLGLIELGPTAVGIALLVALSARRYLSLANADALLPALMSTQRLTFYYWGQDRLANVVPLLAWPIRDPIWNFRFQMLVYGSGFFALLAMFVWFHFHATERRATGLVLAVASTVTGLLVLAPMRRGTGYAFVFEQVYALSLALFLAGLRLLVNGSSSRSRHRLGSGAALVMLGVLLNPSAALASPVMWLLDDEIVGRVRRLVGGLGAVLSAFIVYTVTSRVWATGPNQRQYYDNFSFKGIADALDTTASRILGSLDLSIASLLGIACVALIVVRWRTWPARLQLLYACAPIFGLGWLLVFAANEWVAINIYSYRYFFPVFAAGMLLVSAAVAEATALLRGMVGERQPLEPTRSAGRVLALCGTLAASLMVAIAVISNTDIEALESAEDSVETARRLDVRLVAGDYWSTWPVVLAGRDAGLDLIGVAGRSDPIVDDITAEVRYSMRQDGFVRALCPGLDLGHCASDLSYWTGQQWSAELADRSDPSVIDLEPIP